jgi:hypothetical protein
MAWSRSATNLIGLGTAGSLLYLAAFIPIYFFYQDSPNPPIGPNGEKFLAIGALQAMAIYVVVYVFYLAHLFGVYPGSASRRFWWFIAFFWLTPAAMVIYWTVNLRAAHRADPDGGI